MSLHTAGMLQLLQPLVGKRDTQTSLSPNLHAKTCTYIDIRAQNHLHTCV